jgi:phospholipid/cholesterol/gamma-HCH transport system permease protein
VTSDPDGPKGTKTDGKNNGDPDDPRAQVTGVLGKVGGAIASPFLGFVTSFGEHMSLLGRACAWLVRPPFRLRLFLDQMEFIGVGSLPIILLVGFFSGAVSALQGVTALGIFNQERWVGVTVGLALAEELAPVFTGLMITARAGSGMATELGSMRITEQIDALTTFAVNPVQYLITPRIVACTLMMPIMTMAFNMVGLMGAYVVAIVVNDLDYGQVTGLFSYWVDVRNYGRGLIKAAVFGVAIALGACYQGFFVRGGAKEVGLATTRAVVVGSVSILVIDYFLIEILNVVWPGSSA